MLKKEKRWRRFYVFLMIFVYAVYTPVSFFEWLAVDGGFPFVAILVCIALPFMRKNHLQQLRQEKN